MELLFFNSNDVIDVVAARVFGFLGVNSAVGESKNVLNEFYHVAEFFGMRFKIEENSYDYEDQFKFMLSVGRDVIRGAIVRDDDLVAVARIVQHLLADNLGLNLVLEVGTELEGGSPE